jgi:hypothetical protein
MEKDKDSFLADCNTKFFDTISMHSWTTRRVWRKAAEVVSYGMHSV